MPIDILEALAPDPPAKCRLHLSRKRIKSFCGAKPPQAPLDERVGGCGDRRYADFTNDAPSLG
jgi:hypothetical protein